MVGPVAVTGASGFIASHVVQQLLEQGHAVHGTVRDVADDAKTAHLRALAGAAERLSLFSADLTVAGSFDAAIDGCEAVIHIATPIDATHASADGEATIYAPAMAGLQTVLDASLKAGTVKTFVLTSSMSAMAPQPPPDVKSEAHWSDAEAQKARGNWYGAAKTSQELLAARMLDGTDVRYIAICPTMVLGPQLQPTVAATMDRLRTLAKGRIVKAANDSMSYIDVRDCAAMHVAACIRPEASGRYMCLVESLHWNDIAKIMKELVPEMTEIEPCDGEPCVPTQFDRSRMDSLGVSVRPVRAIFVDAIADLRERGVL